MKKMLKNKTILYIVLFIAVTNVMGYLMVNNVDAIILLFLVGLLTSYFSKNMIVVMLAAIVFTNLLVGSKVASRTPLLEGFSDPVGVAEAAVEEAEAAVEEAEAAVVKAEENGADDDELSKAQDMLADAETELSNAVAVVEAEKEKVEAEKEKAEAKKDNAVRDTPEQRAARRARYAEARKADGDAKCPHGVNEAGECNTSGFTNLSPASIVENDKASELDFPGSIEAAYDNLDKLLSSDAINKMSKDTQNLADKQHKLMGNIDKLGPLMANAKKMMDGLNTGKIDKLLSGFIKN